MASTFDMDLKLLPVGAEVILTRATSAVGKSIAGFADSKAGADEGNKFADRPVIDAAKW